MEKAEKETVRPAGELRKHTEKGSASSTGRRYGEALKRQVVEQIEAGKVTLSQAQRQHGIAGAQTIRGWQARYGKAGGGGGGARRSSALGAAQAQIEKLRREKAELEHALSRSTVKVIVLESAMEEAEVQYGEDFKKKFATALSNARGDSSGRKG
jgi:transposase-like protein